MFKQALFAAFLGLMLVGISAQAQKIEMVHSINYEDSSRAKAALDALFGDAAMRGAKATLYALDAGDGRSSHLVVEDFDRYADRVAVDKKRRESHAWARYLLATPDSDYVGTDMVTVVDDHGQPRHTAEYLIASLVHTTDAAGYRDALTALHEAVGDPGVLRLVAVRTGNRKMTHAVLIGAKDFAAANEYLDKVYASKAFEDFMGKVGDTRKIVGVHMYRRVGSWGY